jgi:LmbE family N-acetylglucosaminyl deacetylase
MIPAAQLRTVAVMYILGTLLLFRCGIFAGPRALPSNPQDGAGSPTLVLMCLSAHPDDEDGGALAYYSRLKGVKSYTIFFTRGEGGQNEIGSELYDDLGAIRTKETIEAANILGSVPYFLGFADFGFSKTAKETFAKWGGRDSVLSRLVYCIRALKPDVVVTHHDTITTEPNRQHGNHQAVGISAYEAFTKAADPSFHPEQLSDSVGVWQVKKLYVLLRSRDSSMAKTGSVVDIDISAGTAEGPSIAELSLSALQRHRSQGLDKLTRASIPDFFNRHRFILTRSDRKYPYDPRDLFSGIEPATRVQHPLPRPTGALSPFSIRVSPEYVPRTGTGKFLVTFIDRGSRPFARCTLSVIQGGKEIFRKQYGPEAGNRSDTLRLKFDSGSGPSDSALLFRATALTGGDSISSEFRVSRLAVPATASPGTLVGLVNTYDNTDEETLESFSVPYRSIDSTELETGNLDRYSAIILDLRAYAYRPDAAAHNDRLLDYVRNGGNLISFYHKQGDWNGKQFSPYPIFLTYERVTEEDAPVTILLPRHKLLNEPNRIKPSDWDGWVQERSIYLPAADTLRTSGKYERILGMSDQDEHQPPTSLLWARYGRGSYTYVSLALYRQLRILQGGAVRLFLNLISQPRN